jgi:2-keto-4-pentenoate hydratase/2-oxohepta-3-ene-1,7-dioic acid hydratase in catechol pathway
MKFLRFRSNKDARVYSGLLEDDTVYEIQGNFFEEYKINRNKHLLSEIRFLPPCSPTKIVAVGLNYRDHAQEMKKSIPEEPLLFMKPSTAIAGHEDKIIYPKHMSSRLDYEGELALIIGKKAKWVDEREAFDYVFGYTCINDITARDLQIKDVQYTRAKGFDTFAPIGPVIETSLDPSDLEISTFLNGERKQHSRTSQLVFSIPKLIAFITRVMTLLPGDVIATGTPSGIGQMKKGDMVEVKVEGIGTLRNYID